MRIQVVKQIPPGLLKQEVVVADHSTIADVLEAVGLEVEPGWGISVWGERKEGTYVLEDGDRIEVSAPLVADPKLARRMRQQRQEEAKKKQWGR